MIALVLTALAIASGGDSAVASGLWRTPTDGGSIIRMEACGDALCGRIVTSPAVRANPDQRDVRNKDQTLRGRTLKGLLILKVRHTGPNVWGDGWAYDPTDGGAYRGSMKLAPDGTLRLTGCIFVPLCRSQTWTRAN